MPSVCFTFVVRASKAIVHSIVDTFITSPLHTLYFHGPLLHGYGFWGGASAEDICAALMPGTTASFWTTQPVQCAIVMDRRFYAFLTATTTLLYGVALYKLIHAACFYLFIMRPLLRSASRLVRHHARGHCLEHHATHSEDDNG